MDNDKVFKALGDPTRRRLLDLLENDNLKQAAVLKMEGFTNSEIADQLNCSLSSVERRLRTIRAIWSSE